jgi:hypothetical protein
MPPHGASTVSGGSNAGLQEGGPVGVRAVPTELRWRTRLRSVPSAVVVCNPGAGRSAAGRSSGGLTGGRPSVVSSSDRRESMPSVDAWAGRSPVAGCSPCSSSCATSVSWEPAETAASSTGKKGRAKGAIARKAASQAANQRCSLSPRCVRAPTGTRPSPARPTPPDRGASRQQQRMVLTTRSVKGHQRQRPQALRAGRGAPLASEIRRAARRGAILPDGGFGYTDGHRSNEVRS